MIDVRGKWTLITGASRGFGRLSAKYMAEAGSNLILHARKLENLNAIVNELKETTATVVTVEAELSDLSAVERMLKTIDSFGIVPDIILNNAGLQIAYRQDYFSTPSSDYEISFRVNTIAPMMIAYHFLPHMIAKGFGRIVNTTSGINNEPQQAGYSASKAALSKVTADLGNTLNNKNVLINLTDPGWCKTDLGGQWAPNTPESAIPGILIGAFIDDGISGRCFRAEEYHGMTLQDAVKLASTNCEP